MLKLSQKTIEPEKYIDNLIEFCKGREDIIALYLFGSRAKDVAGPLSDIDIAILLKEGLGKESYKEKESFYWSKANETLHTDEVSFVLLNIAPLTIQYGVITDSKVLYSKDDGLRLSFEERIINKYMDFRLILNEYDREFLKQIKEGTAFD